MILPVAYHDSLYSLRFCCVKCERDDLLALNFKLSLIYTTHNVNSTLMTTDILFDKMNVIRKVHS